MSKRNPTVGGQTKRIKNVPPKAATVQFGCVRECGAILSSVFQPGVVTVDTVYCHCKRTHHISGHHDGYGQISEFVHAIEELE